MSDVPQNTQTHGGPVTIRDDQGRFLPGTIPPPKPRGALGGRAQALRTLDSIMGRERNQENLANAFQSEFDRDPIRFFKQIIMPLLPQDVKIKLGEEGIVQWQRLSTMFPTQASAEYTDVIDVSEPSAADGAGTKPSALPPN